MFVPAPSGWKSESTLKPENTRKTKYRDQNNVDRNRFFSAEMEQIHAERNNIFKYADDRGEGGEEQE